MAPSIGGGLEWVVEAIRVGGKGRDMESRHWQFLLTGSHGRHI